MKKTIIKIIVIIFALIVCYLFCDFYRVVNKNKKPLINIKKELPNGILYQGLGYGALYCYNGLSYHGIITNDCEEVLDDDSMKKIIYVSIMYYLSSNEYIDEDNFDDIEIYDYKYEKYDGKERIFKVKLTIKCKNNNNCILLKDLENSNEINVVMDKEYKTEKIY